MGAGGMPTLRRGPGSRSVSCFYFSAGRAPLPDPVLVLNGEGRGPINNLAVMSNAARRSPHNFLDPGALLSGRRAAEVILADLA